MSSAGLPTTRLSPPPERWEYQILYFDVDGLFGPYVDAEELEVRLNAAGNAGWELVTIVDLNAGSGRTSQLMVTLKRRITA
jgi:hypothetical protein